MDITKFTPQRLILLRQVITAAGFAEPLFGVDPKKRNDEELNKVSKNYQLFHYTFL